MAPMKCPTSRQTTDVLEADVLEESYSLTHLAHRWGVSRRVIRRRLQAGELPFVQIEGQLRVPSIAVQNAEATPTVPRRTPQ